MLHQEEFPTQNGFPRDLYLQQVATKDPMELNLPQPWNSEIYVSNFANFAADLRNALYDDDSSDTSDNTSNHSSDLSSTDESASPTTPSPQPRKQKPNKDQKPTNYKTEMCSKFQASQ